MPACAVKRLDAIRTHPCQGRVKPCQGGVKERLVRVRRSLTDAVIENLIAAVIGVILLAYLGYALVRPDDF